MKKRIFIIHGWGGNPNKDWLPWVVSQLKNMGYEVNAPFMPDTDNPKIKPWVDKLKEIVGRPQESDILIGHSIGCQTILRFLEGLETGLKVDKIIMVAPWFTLTNLGDDEAWKIADPWLRTPINLSQVLSKTTSITAIFSDNDSWVPLKANETRFKETLNPKIIILNNKGHFSQEEGITKLPEILDLL